MESCPRQCMVCPDASQTVNWYYAIHEDEIQIQKINKTKKKRTRKYKFQKMQQLKSKK